MGVGDPFGGPPEVTRRGGRFRSPVVRTVKAYHAPTRSEIQGRLTLPARLPRVEGARASPKSSNIPGGDEDDGGNAVTENEVEPAPGRSVHDRTHGRPAGSRLRRPQPTPRSRRAAGSAIRRG